MPQRGSWSGRIPHLSHDSPPYGALQARHIFSPSRSNRLTSHFPRRGSDAGPLGPDTDVQELATRQGRTRAGNQARRACKGRVFWQFHRWGFWVLWCGNRRQVGRRVMDRWGGVTRVPKKNTKSDDREIEDCTRNNGLKTNKLISNATELKPESRLLSNLCRHFISLYYFQAIREKAEFIIAKYSRPVQLYQGLRSWIFVSKARKPSCKVKTKNQTSYSQRAIHQQLLNTNSPSHSISNSKRHSSRSQNMGISSTSAELVPFRNCCDCCIVSLCE